MFGTGKLLEVLGIGSNILEGKTGGRRKNTMR